jgi:hypothetical protein
MQIGANNQQKNGTTKKYSVVYTSEELIQIGNLLKHGDAANIARLLGANYFQVKKILTGNSGKPLTSKSKVGVRIVQEAVGMVQIYLHILKKKQAEQAAEMAKYEPLSQKYLNLPIHPSL